MYKTFAVTVLALTLSGGLHAQKTAAEPGDTPNLNALANGMFADGTWDCSDSAGDYLGAIVIADLSYAFIYPDSKVGTYGKLNKDTWVDAPGFFVLSGEVKEKFGGVGMNMLGPLGNPNDYTDWAKMRLQVVITAENLLQCYRRQGSAG